MLKGRASPTVLLGDNTQSVEHKLETLQKNGGGAQDVHSKKKEMQRYSDPNADSAQMGRSSLQGQLISALSVFIALPARTQRK